MLKGTRALLKPRLGGASGDPGRPADILMRLTELCVVAPFLFFTMFGNEFLTSTFKFGVF